MTHIALPVRNLQATLDFYDRYTDLVMIHERHDPETEGVDVARFVIVLIEGKLPTAITGDIQEEYGFLTSISHLGISCNSREEVDEIAARAKADGNLLLGPMYRNEIVGYICIVTDPDGNNIEFSVEQILG